ncbi:Glucan endo-1,3-beta-glucosidase-like protein 3 [Acorus gramineus]|uniref:Glucan endo-1,3-beta-glucosidase-like protein 3 n=1 Tax=Acorus gramineus TaxID=55184 RepID=A0AAV9B9N0_ACOGR|nr:Glucan endo-1,3-beta-glucosidase-like protein 3 [Acorus gramineus]
MGANMVLIFGFYFVEGATWCVCRSDVSDPALQKTIDYACGAGADCTPIISSGVCYQPNTVRAHCSYAANSYFQKKGQAQGSCDFSGTATLSTTDPSFSGCAYPSTAGTAGTTPTSTSSPGTTTTPNTNSPFGGTSTTNGGVLGTTTGLGPSGTSIGPDGSDGGKILLTKAGIMGSLFLTTLFTGILKGWI